MWDSVMTNIAIVSYVSGLLCLLIFYSKRSLRYLQFFQQEEYEGQRFINWYFRKKAFDRRGSLVSLILFGINLVFLIILPNLSQDLIITVLQGTLNIIGATSILIITLKEEDPRKTGKIKLKMTDRAQRIFNLARILYSLTVVSTMSVIFLFSSYQSQITYLFYWLIALILIQINPFYLVMAKLLLDSHEQKLQENFANQAREIIKNYNPTIIGITGSYGKTSSKVILNTILGSVCPTFSTPGSINTYMGMTRQIRENMKPEHKYAIVEMGAYHMGSIKRMCSLTPPKVGLITWIGIMHLERFGGQEFVYKAKKELAESIPYEGILVLNGDNDYCRKVGEEEKKKTTLFYGLDKNKGPLDAYMFDIKSSNSGSSFKIEFQNKIYEGNCKLLGKALLSNILGSFTLSCALGINPEIVLAAITNVKTESNRLEAVKCEISSLTNSLIDPDTNTSVQIAQGTITRLNDAYNSNPQGFSAALDVLAEMPGKRKILVTPGMIELGEKQNEENKKAAEKAAKICDHVLIVGPTNEQALVSGLEQTGNSNCSYKKFNDMRSAFDYLARYCQQDDIVLIENDLPDVYESKISF